MPVGNPEPDPAAIYAIANSLENYSKTLMDIPEYDVSDTYSGTDQFLRECMRVAEVFETWACKHVNFEAMSDIYVYKVQDDFAAALAQLNRPGDPGIMTLQDFTEDHCLRVALFLTLPILSQ